MNDEDLKKMRETCAGDGAPVFRAIIDAALDSRAERDMYLATVRLLKAETAKDVAALATGRALAFEEAARYWRLHKIADSTEEQFAADLRALAPLPPSLQAVPVEVVAKVGEVLDRQTTHLETSIRAMNEAAECPECGTVEDHDPFCTIHAMEFLCADGLAALAALAASR